MDWSPHLAAGETLRWQGRPAPRCYTFRNWRHSVFGLMLLAVSLLWLHTGAQLADEVRLGLWQYLPAPFVAAGAYLSFGHLVRARLEWEEIFFAITNRRLLLRRGKGGRVCGMALSQLTFVRLRPLGQALGTLQVHAGGDSLPLRLCCVEHPQKPLELLRLAIEDNERRSVPDSV